MEVFSTVWFIFMLYCSEWFGIRQCYAVPVPTLTNYRHGYYSSKNSWNYRPTRYPESKYEQFVFPSKQQEDIPNVVERSGFASGDSSSKIFFPDEIPFSSSEKGYHYSDTKEARPVWQTHHRPSTAVSSSHEEWPTLDQMMSMQESSKDGSIQTAIQMQQLPADGNVKLKTSGQEGITFKSPLRPLESSKTSKAIQEERVQEAVQEFYHWLKLSKDHPKNRQNNNKSCLETSQTGSAAVNANQGSSNLAIITLSDQSLVAGLKDGECPEGQIRLENGECRVKVEI